MKTTRWALIAIVALGVSSALQAGELGDKAPPLKIKEWVKGDPVDVTKADGKHVYVVEFWATWCPPCRESIPHLTELQKEFKDKNVTFVGVSIDDEKTVDRVKPFVVEKGDTMDYTVALDKDGKTAKAYLYAHYVSTIPHAFIVDQQGRIVWHDDPMKSLEEKLTQVVAGKFDLAAARKEMAPVYAERRKAWIQREYLEEYFRLVQSTGNEKEASELGRKIIEAARDDALIMNAFAWNILTKEGVVSRDVKLALVAAEAANEASKGENAAVLDTYALALFENGHQDKAVKVQTKAVRLAKENDDPAEMIAELEQRLERFKKNAD